jgi:hypothetical protein
VLARPWLVFSQVSLVLVLAIASMRPLRGICRATDIDLGFSPDNVLVMPFQPRLGARPNRAVSVADSSSGNPASRANNAMRAWPAARRKPSIETTITQVSSSSAGWLQARYIPSAA